jgi:DNA polymerase III delta prime subunit
MNYNTIKVKSIVPVGIKNVIDITVHKNHTFVTETGMVVHNCNSTQPALRNFMEEFSSNCGFILTCNFKNRIIEPLHSRVSVIDFKIAKSDYQKLASQFFKRVIAILDKENITYDKAVVAELISKHMPDWRRVLNELQRYSVNGTIDTGIFINISDDNFKSLIEILKTKNFKEMRVWVGENTDSDSTEIFRKFYDTSYNYVNKNSIPELVLLISKYQYQSAFVADHEINMAAFFTEVMANIEFNQ